MPLTANKADIRSTATTVARAFGWATNRTSVKAWRGETGSTVITISCSVFRLVTFTMFADVNPKYFVLSEPDVATRVSAIATKLATTSSITFCTPELNLVIARHWSNVLIWLIVVFKLGLAFILRPVQDVSCSWDASLCDRNIDRTFIGKEPHTVVCIKGIAFAVGNCNRCTSIKLLIKNLSINCTLLENDIVSSRILVEDWSEFCARDRQTLEES